MSEVIFKAAEGSKIGGSFSTFEFTDIGVVLGIDYGGMVDGDPDHVEPDYTIADRVDYLLLTHGHWDHVGALPLFRRRFPGAKIFATRETVLLIDVLLY